MTGQGKKKTREAPANKWDVDNHTSSGSLTHLAGNLNNKPAARNNHTAQPELKLSPNRFALKPLALALSLRALGAVSSSGGAPGHGAAALAALPVCVLTGCVFGLVNGLIITVLSVNSLIATLGTLGIGTGFAYVLTGGNDVYGLPTVMQSRFALFSIWRIPLPLVLGVLVAVWLAFVLRRARFGLRTLAIGSNRTSAERSGIRIKPHIVKLTTLAGGLAGLAGYIDLSRFLSTNVNGHTLDALNAVTAVILGGTALLGGRIAIAGTVWGTLLASVLLDGLVVLNVQSFYQEIATGAILIAAIALGQLRERRAAT